MNLSISSNKLLLLFSWKRSLIEISSKILKFFLTKKYTHNPLRQKDYSFQKKKCDITQEILWNYQSFNVSGTKPVFWFFLEIPRLIVVNVTQMQNKYISKPIPKSFDSSKVLRSKETFCIIQLWTSQKKQSQIRNSWST